MFKIGDKVKTIRGPEATGGVGTIRKPGVNPGLMPTDAAYIWWVELDGPPSVNVVRTNDQLAEAEK